MALTRGDREPGNVLRRIWRFCYRLAASLDWIDGDPPSTRDFGSARHEGSSLHEAGGPLARDHLPAGVGARIGLPAQGIVDVSGADQDMSDLPFSGASPDPAGPDPAGPDPARRAIAGADDSHPSVQPREAGSAARHRFAALVVEDNMLIAMDAEEALRDLGAGQVQLCANVANALDTIGITSFDVALLDVHLGDETSEAIAVELRERGIPFVMTTGFGDYVSNISAYAGAPVLTKPYAPAALSRALAQLMG